MSNKNSSSADEVKRQFFYQSGREVKPKPFDPSFRLMAVEDSDGSTSIKRVCIEQMLEPLSTLKFSDVQISTLIKNGISPKHLQIQIDERHSDLLSDVEKFNSMITENIDKMFNN